MASFKRVASGNAIVEYLLPLLLLTASGSVAVSVLLPGVPAFMQQSLGNTNVTLRTTAGPALPVFNGSGQPGNPTSSVTQPSTIAENTTTVALKNTVNTTKPASQPQLIETTGVMGGNTQNLLNAVQAILDQVARLKSDPDLQLCNNNGGGSRNSGIGIQSDPRSDGCSVLDILVDMANTGYQLSDIIAQGSSENTLIPLWGQFNSLFSQYKALMANPAIASVALSASPQLDTVVSGSADVINTNTENHVTGANGNAGEVKGASSNICDQTQGGSCNGNGNGQGSP